MHPNCAQISPKPTQPVTISTPLHPQSRNSKHGSAPPQHRDLFIISGAKQTLTFPTRLAVRYKTTLLLKQTQGAGTTGTHVPSSDGSDRVWVPQNQGTPPHARARARLQHSTFRRGFSDTANIEGSSHGELFPQPDTVGPDRRRRRGSEYPGTPSRCSTTPTGAEPSVASQRETHDRSFTRSFYPEV